MATTAHYLNQYVSTTLASVGGITDSATTGIILASTTNIETTKPGIACLTYTDPIDTSKAEWITYTSIDGSKELQGVTRGQEGFSAKAHDNGATIAFPLSESHINNLNDALIIGADEENLVEGVLDEDDMASDSATKLATQQSIKAYTDGKIDYKYGMYKNLITNGNFDVAQSGTSFTSATTPANSDDTYLLDNWNLISDGNDTADITQTAVTDLPGSNYAIGIDIETAKRVGIAQFIEAKDAQKLKGKTVSLSFAVKSANVTALRATILSWASTADSITSDVVGTWGATPTWATNWTDNATPADLTVTTSWTTVKVEGIVLDEATVNNLAIVIWTPNEETIGDIVYISQVKVNEGATAITYSPKSYAQELRDCQRYYQKYSSESDVLSTIAIGFNISTTVFTPSRPLVCKMRIDPVVTVSAVDDFVVTHQQSNTATTNIIDDRTTIDTLSLSVTVASGLTAGQGATLRSNNKTTAWIACSARL